MADILIYNINLVGMTSFEAKSLFINAVTMIILGISALCAWFAYKNAAKAAAERSRAEQAAIEATTVATKEATKAAVERNISQQRIIAKRNTYALMLKNTADEDLIKASGAMQRAIKDDSFLTILREAQQSPKTAKAKEKRDAAARELNQIKLILNLYEMVALGIEDENYDEQAFYKWWRTTYVKTFIAARPYIEQGKKRNPKLYINYHTQAFKWCLDDKEREAVGTPYQEPIIDDCP